MNAILSLLGTAMLALVSVAVVLAVVILVLYEACWIIRLGGRLHRSTWNAERICADSERTQDKHGGD